MLCQTIFFFFFFPFPPQFNHSEYQCLRQPELDLGSYCNKCWLSAIKTLSGVSENTRDNVSRRLGLLCWWHFLFIFPFSKPSCLPLFWWIIYTALWFEVAYITRYRSFEWLMAGQSHDHFYKCVFSYEGQYYNRFLSFSLFILVLQDKLEEDVQILCSKISPLPNNTRTFTTP